MFRHVALIAAFAASFSLVATPAQAVEVKPLTLSSYTLNVLPPVSPASTCDYNFVNCGSVTVTAHFSGLNGRTRPQPGQRYGNLSGTVNVTRTYGCQNSKGKRLHKYDVKVDRVEDLNTRRGMGYTIPAEGDTLDVSTYAFLLDAQPDNCPAGSQPMTYAIKARTVKLELTSYITDLIPSKNYNAPAKAQWVGAVPTPAST